VREGDEMMNTMEFVQKRVSEDPVLAKAVSVQQVGNSVNLISDFNVASSRNLACIFPMGSEIVVRTPEWMGVGRFGSIDQALKDLLSTLREAIEREVAVGQWVRFEWRAV
jgi:hypothetical protein